MSGDFFCEKACNYSKITIKVERSHDEPIGDDSILPETSEAREADGGIRLQAAQAREASACARG